MNQKSFREIFSSHFEELCSKNNIQLHQFKGSNEKVVILCTGSYCPAHLGHLSMMDLAREKISQKKDFAFGIFSPTCDHCMNGKIQDLKMNIEERVKYFQILIKENGKQNEYIVDDFEGKQPRFINYPDICEIYRDFFKFYNIKLAYCIGSDLLKYNVQKEFQYFADFLIIIERDQCKIPTNIQETDTLFIIKNAPTSHITSTQIRKEIIERKKLQSQSHLQNQQHSDQI